MKEHFLLTLFISDLNHQFTMLLQQDFGASVYDGLPDLSTCPSVSKYQICRL